MNYSTKWRDIPPDIPPMYRIFWRSPNLFKADICPIAATYALEPRKTVVGGNLAKSKIYTTSIMCVESKGSNFQNRSSSIYSTLWISIITGIILRIVADIIEQIIYDYFLWQHQNESYQLQQEYTAHKLRFLGAHK